MIHTPFHTFVLILCLALGMILVRFLPFLLFPETRATPSFIAYLGDVLPPAMAGLLVVYCFRSIDLIHYPYGIPEIIAGFLVAFLQRWKHSTLLSIASGVIAYMLMIQLVFIR